MILFLFLFLGNRDNKIFHTLLKLVEDKLLNKLREDAVSLFHVGIEAASPYNLIPNHMLLEENILTISDINGASKSFDLNNYKKIKIIGAGKASTSMAYEVEKILDGKIDEGLVVTKSNFRSELKRIQALNKKVVEEYLIADKLIEVEEYGKTYSVTINKKVIDEINKINGYA